MAKALGTPELLVACGIQAAQYPRVRHRLSRRMESGEIPIRTPGSRYLPKTVGGPKFQKLRQLVFDSRINEIRLRRRLLRLIPNLRPPLLRRLRYRRSAIADSTGGSNV